MCYILIRIISWIFWRFWSYIALISVQLHVTWFTCKLKLQFIYESQYLHYKQLDEWIMEGKLKTKW